MREPRLVCAALRLKIAGLESVSPIICGPRHFDEIMRNAMFDSHFPINLWKSAEQGFVDQFGTFYTREEARKVAEAQNQIIREVGREDILFSENLY